MTEAVLHIGTPKTGTTYLQLALQLNRYELGQQGWHIPEAGSDVIDAADPTGRFIGSTVCHHKLAWCVQPGRPPIGEIKSETVDQVEQKLHDVMARHDRILLSSECLYWELRDIAQIRRVRAMLPERTRVVVWLRNRWSFIDSIYAQSVYDHSVSQSLSDFIAANLSALNYGAALSQWANVFGASNIEVRLYGRNVDPFTELVNLLGLEQERFTSPNIDTNSSVPTALISILSATDLSRAQFVHLADSMKSVKNRIPVCRLLSSADLLHLSSQFRDGDIFLQQLGVNITELVDPLAYLQLPHASEVSLEAAVGGLAQIFKAVM